MNVSHYIAKKIAFTREKTFTKIIVRFAIASIALSLTTMIVTTSVLDGFKSEIMDKVFGFWGHIHITDTSINNTMSQIPIDYSEKYIGEIREQKQFSTTDDSGNTRVSKQGIHHLQPFAVSPGIITTKNEFGAIFLKGINNEFQWDYVDNFMIEGRPIQDFEKGRELVISKYTAQKLNIKLNDKIIVAFIKNQKKSRKRFEVVGIYNTGLVEYDEKFALVPLPIVQEILEWNPNQVSGVEVFIENVDDLDIIDKDIYDQIPNRIYSESIRTKYPSIFEWLSLQDINMVVILTLMIIVAIINMITSLLIIILERTNMIGVLKSIGANDWTVRKIFIYNAAYIIGWGLLIGNILGIGICLIQHYTHVFTLDEANYYLSYAPVRLIWWKIVLLNILCFVVTILFLIAPTYLVTRISPIKALRFG